MLLSPIFLAFPVLPFTPLEAKSCHFFLPSSSTFFCAIFRPVFGIFEGPSAALLDSRLLASANSVFIVAGCEIMALLDIAEVVGVDEAEEGPMLFPLLWTGELSSLRFLLAKFEAGLICCACRVSVALYCVNLTM